MKPPIVTELMDPRSQSTASVSANGNMSDFEVRPLASYSEPQPVQNRHRKNQDGGHDEQLPPGCAIVCGASCLPRRPALLETLINDMCRNRFL